MNHLGVPAACSEGIGIAVDSSDYIYITGRMNGISGVNQAFIAKYDAFGARQWVDFLGSEYFDHGVGIAVDFFGNIYVTGIHGNVCGAYDAFVAKYDSNFARQWAKKIGVTTIDLAVKIDSLGNPVITGCASENLDGIALTGTADAFICKYSPDGTLW